MGVAAAALLEGTVLNPCPDIRISEGADNRGPDNRRSTVLVFHEPKVSGNTDYE